jgi:hypothetical protein
VEEPSGAAAAGGACCWHIFDGMSNGGQAGPGRGAPATSRPSPSTGSCAGRRAAHFGGGGDEREGERKGNRKRAVHQKNLYPEPTACSSS